MNLRRETKKVTIGEQIMKQLQDDLSFGRFKPGDKLPTEPELMTMYRAGRSSVREALKKLENLGFITIRQGAGSFVNTHAVAPSSSPVFFKRQVLKEVNDVRYMLEREALKLALQYRTPEDIHRIREALDDRKSAILNKRYELCIDADVRFHNAIALASHNGALSNLYAHFSVQLREYFEERDMQNIHKFALSHGLHEQLLNTIEIRNEEQAFITLDKLLHNNYWKYGF